MAEGRLDKVTIRNADDPTGMIRTVLGHRPVRAWALETRDPNVLLVNGPIVPVVLSNPDGAPASEPLAGADGPIDALIIDTGASRSGIIPSEVRRLGLTSHRSIPMVNASGTAVCPLYHVKVSITLFDDQGRPVEVSRVLEVGLTGSLAALLQGISMLGRDLRPVGLLGRDFLRFATLIYDGPSGGSELRISKANVAKMTTNDKARG